MGAGPNTSVRRGGASTSGRGSTAPPLPPRVFHMRHDSDFASPSSTSTILFHDTPIRVMFDTSATHCFLAEGCVKRLGIECSSCPSFIVGLPDGSKIQGSREVLSCPLVLGDREWPADLIVMDMPHEDILLGMSWLQRYSSHRLEDQDSDTKSR